MSHTKGELQIMECSAVRVDIDSQHNFLLFGENAEANAERLVKCWNCHDDLVAGCEAGVAPNVIQEYERWVANRIKAPNLAVYRIQFEGLLRLLKRMFTQSEKSLAALAKKE